MVDSGFDYLGNLVWSLPIGSEFASLPFLSIFELENEVTLFERSRLDLLVVVALDLMLVVLNEK